MFAGTMITGAASPASVEDLENALARYVLSPRHAKSRDLRETLVAGPALLSSAEVRVGRDVAAGLL
jgi:hypothetical protein